MDLPLVSVVMPVYNSDKYLKEAIDSVLSQSYQNLELLIVNDGSTDASRDIILSYSDTRIRFFENTSNSGIVFTRNRGLEAARGEFVATLDSDDIALPDRIERQVDFLSTHQDYGMCGTFYHTIDSHGMFLKKIRLPTGNRDIITFLTLGNCFCNSTVMIRKKLALELKYRENYDIVEDYELWSRISKRAKLANLPFYGTWYRVHGNNISVAKMNEMFARVKMISWQILTDLKIRFTDNELEIHSNWLNRNISYFDSSQKIKALEDWLQKLFSALRSDGRFNSRLMYALISEKWIVILVNTKRYKQILNNRVFRFNKFRYLLLFSRMVLSRVLNLKKEKIFKLI